MGKHGSLLESLGIVISTSIRGLFLEPKVLVCLGGCGMCGIWVVVVARSARICINFVVDIMLRKARIV